MPSCSGREADYVRSHGGQVQVLLSVEEVNQQGNGVCLSTEVTSDGSLAFAIESTYPLAH